MNASYERVKAAAQERAHDTLDARRTVLNRVLVEQNRLQAEPDEDRRISRVAKVVGVEQGVAAQIARGDDPREIEALTPPQVRKALAMQGETVDFLEVVFLEKARAAAHAVGLVVDEDDEGLGTCFMISPDLLITNNHVIEDAAAAESCMVEFNFEVDERGQERRTTRFHLNPERFFATNPDPDLDFTVVALGERESGRLRAADLGFCRISAAENKHALGDYVNIIQHPDGTDKQVVLRENLLVHRGETVLLYTTDTGEGSSGAPVFNDEWQVVALHHFAETSGTIQLANGVEVDDEINEGIRASRIAAALVQLRGTMSDDERELLDGAIEASEVEAGEVPVPA